MKPHISGDTDSRHISSWARSDRQSGWIAPTVPALRLTELISALSYALDLTEGQPPGHCVRCCWIGYHIGQEIGLQQQQLQDLYYTLLLKDIGCSSNAERLCQLYGDDDREVKSDYAKIDHEHLDQLARFVFRHAEPGKGLEQRLRRVFYLMRHGQNLANELVQTRCERGALIARSLGFSDDVADGVHCLDEHWNGKGRPQQKSGKAIPIYSQIALLSQVADVFCYSNGPQTAVEEIRQRSGHWFNPQLVRAFESVAAQETLWSTLQASDLLQQVEQLLSDDPSMLLSEKRLDDIAFAFAQIIDSKSHFTYGHSERVAAYAGHIARCMGIGSASLAWLRRGALLHDLGKLGVSNAILDKPDRLTSEEWISVKRHPQLTQEILTRIKPFGGLARIAGAHHERLDGRGYPYGLEAKDIAIETRIITTADIFDALTAERPYRPAMPTEKALTILTNEMRGAVDPDCLEALNESLRNGSIHPDSP